MKNRSVKKAVKELIKKAQFKAMKASEIINRFESLTQEEKQILFKTLICTNHTGKMEDMISLSTSVKLNKRCTERAKVKGSICESCFANAQLSYQTSTAKRYEKNHLILTNCVFNVEDLPLINALLFRLESFGDLENTIQAKNYINLCIKNPRVTFALWTKNPDILFNTFRLYHLEKPENMIVIYSSPFVNKSAYNVRNLYILANGKPMIDKVFTVYTKEYATANDIAINCGARHCFTCQNCYDKNNGIVEISEIKK